MKALEFVFFSILFVTILRKKTLRVFNFNSFSATRGADILTVCRRGRRPRRPADLHKLYFLHNIKVENTTCFRFHFFVLRGRRIRSLTPTPYQSTRQRGRTLTLYYPYRLRKRSRRVRSANLGWTPFVYKASATVKKIYVVHFCALPLILKLHLKFS